MHTVILDQRAKYDVLAGSIWSSSDCWEQLVVPQDQLQLVDQLERLLPEWRLLAGYLLHLDLLLSLVVSYLLPLMLWIRTRLLLGYLALPLVDFPLHLLLLLRKPLMLKPSSNGVAESVQQGRRFELSKGTSMDGVYEIEETVQWTCMQTDVQWKPTQAQQREIQGDMEQTLSKVSKDKIQLGEQVHGWLVTQPVGKAGPCRVVSTCGIEYDIAPGYDYKLERAKKANQQKGMSHFQLVEDQGYVNGRATWTARRLDEEGHPVEVVAITWDAYYSITDSLEANRTYAITGATQRTCRGWAVYEVGPPTKEASAIRLWDEKDTKASVVELYAGIGGWQFAAKALPTEEAKNKLHAAIENDIKVLTATMEEQ